MRRIWAHQVFVALDQLANAILAGWADETISARSFRLGHRDKKANRWGRWRVMWVFVDVLFWPQDLWLYFRDGAWPLVKHCERAYISECDRLGLPPEYRDKKHHA
jgi:hypothetical protein